MKDFFIKAWQIARGFFVSALDFISDKARTGALIIVTALVLWWLRDVLAGGAQFLFAGVLVATFSATAAYWIDRCLFPSSRPHAIEWDSETWVRRVFCESRRLVIFISVLATVTTWFRGSLFS
jgi:hypothetical protein